MKKTAIIAIGGGMRSAHGAGFLYGLATDLGIVDVDFVVGSSGNSANVLCYASKNKNQYEALKRVWTELLSTSKFISYIRFWKILDIDYLVDVVFKCKVAHGLDALASSEIEYYIPVVEVVTGLPRYLAREDNIDVYEILRASNALPFLYGKEITLSGGVFIDGKIGQTVQDHIDFAISKKADRILVVDDSPERTVLRKIAIWISAYLSTRGLRDAIIRDLHITPTRIVPDGVKVLYVRPSNLPRWIGRDKKKLLKTFEIGRSSAYDKEEEIRKLFL